MAVLRASTRPRRWADATGVEVTVVDRQNHHLFQPLLYQVAMAGLSPADIAAPIRSMMAGYGNVRVLQGEAKRINAEGNSVEFDFGTLPYDYLIVACGASHSYFGNDQWEQHAPGLKTVAQATEIRRRVLAAYEAAERTDDADEQKHQLTFVVVGGGPTGVELAGAIGEMSRFTLAKDFKRINPRLTRVILVEAGPRILPMFGEQSASRAMRDLEKLGVQIWTSTMVTQVDDEGVTMGDENVRAATVLWAAGNEAAKLEWTSPVETDNRGRLVVEADLSLSGLPNVFAAGDQSSFSASDGSAVTWYSSGGDAARSIPGKDNCCKTSQASRARRSASSTKVRWPPSAAAGRSWRSASSALPVGSRGSLGWWSTFFISQDSRTAFSSCCHGRGRTSRSAAARA